MRIGARPRIRILPTISVIALILALLTSLAAAEQPGGEVGCVEGSSTNLGYGDHAFCAINTISDVDTFFFSGAGGTEIRIQAVGNSGSVSPSLQIRDTDGTLLHDGPCTSPCETSNFDLNPSNTLIETGTYQIQISESGSNNTGSYEISLNCLSGPCPGWISVPQLDYDVSVFEVMNPRTDMDFFRFEGTASSEIRIEATGNSGSVSPRVEVRDPDGLLIYDGACEASAPCESGDFEPLTSAKLEKTGTYELQLSEAGSNNTGNYEISLNCIDGACDPDGDLEPHLTDNCGNVANQFQIDHDADGYGTACDGDYNNDGDVTLVDFNAFVASFGDPATSMFDHDNSGSTNLNDFNAFLSFFGGPPGPGSPPIGYDESSFATLTPRTEMDFLRFEGAAGTVIRIQAVGNSGSVAANVEILAPSGARLHDGLCNLTCEPSSFNLIPSPTLTETGTYQIQISESGSNNTGDYELTVDCISGSCPGAPAATPIVYDVPIFETISPRTDVDTFAFEGVAGTEIRLQAVGNSGSVVAKLEVFAPSGTPLHDGPCDLACETADFSIAPSATLPETGVYVIKISESGSNNTGNYEMSLHCLNGACPGAPVPVLLAYDATAPDSLAPRTDMDFFQFAGVAGTLIRITAVGTSGSVTPNVEIRDPTGKRLHNGLCLPNAGCEPTTFSLEPSASLPLTGTYQVQISESGSNNTGNYEVGLTCVFGACQ